MKYFKKIILFFSLISILSCAAKHLKYDHEEQLRKNDEFTTALKISPAAQVPAVASAPVPVKSEIKSDKKEEIKKVPPVNEVIREAVKKKKISKKAEKVAAPERPLTHEPADVEDGTAFVGRRPIKDPFRVGETVIHNVHYFNMSAGSLTLKVDPFVEVNGKKSYSFTTEMRTSSMFSKFYSVEDVARTLVDFDQFVPYMYEFHVKESGQLKEAQILFDTEKNQATYWEKKVTEKSGIEEKKQQWSILPFSQNVFSAIFYMRLFPWELGKEYTFRFADNEENLILKGQAIRKEVLKTELGPMKTIVVKPQITARGNLKPVGDIFIWLSDDDRKLVLRIETNIKIGTLVSEVVNIIPGQ